MTRDRAREAAARALAEAAGLVLPSSGTGGEEEAARAPLYSGLLAEAFAFAAAQHARQVRKGTAVPYVTHLLSVAALVGEHGGSEVEMAAALLHDTVEDTGGAPVLAEIARRFGSDVAAIVEGCTDDDGGAGPGRKRPWIERKTAYLHHLAGAPLSVLRVSASDKLHNLRSISADLAVLGPSLFDRFRAGQPGTLWYYRSLAQVFRALADGEADAGFLRLVHTFVGEVAALERAAPL